MRHGDPEDRRDSPEPFDGARELLLGDTGRHEQITGAPQVAKNELEPELVDLVDRDEQRLLVRYLLVISGQALLEREEFFNPDVVPVRGRSWLHGEREYSPWRAAMRADGVVPARTARRWRQRRLGSALRPQS